VKLVVVKTARAKPRPGRFKGRMRIAADFDAPLLDFADYAE
jgi:hypothetical protein